MKPELNAVRVTWTPPPVDSHSRSMIRFRLEEPSPLSPREGSLLVLVATSPDAVVQVRHAHLSPEHACAQDAVPSAASRGLVRP